MQSLASNAQVAKIGTIDDPSTLLTLNMPDIKKEINAVANNEFEKLPPAARKEASDTFAKSQEEFANKVTHVFSDSLQRIFIVASALIGLSAVLVFTLKEKKLRSASPEMTPGEQ